MVSAAHFSFMGICRNTTFEVLYCNLFSGISRWYHYFINSCPNQEFCKEIHPFLIPIQMGEKDAGEVLSVSRDVSEQYFREEDEAATMAEIGMM